MSLRLWILLIFLIGLAREDKICIRSPLFFFSQVMVPYNFAEFLDDLSYQVKNNVIPMSRIDDAVRRILRVKFVMGLFDNPLADNSLANQVGSPVCGYGSISLNEKHDRSFQFLEKVFLAKIKITMLNRNTENWQGKL